MRAVREEARKPVTEILSSIDGIDDQCTLKSCTKVPRIEEHTLVVDEATQPELRLVAASSEEIPDSSRIRPFSEWNTGPIAGSWCTERETKWLIAGLSL
ncbi:hypothetical protein VTH82DRAFT_3413 [Thermothelomyces myriococcoides]